MLVYSLIVFKYVNLIIRREKYILWRIGYLRRLGSFLGVKNVQYFFGGGGQKNEYFWGYDDFMDIFLGSSVIIKLDYI